MHFIAETTADGVSERLFTLGDVPGVLWTPAGAIGPRPLILLGHGGGQHKKAPGMVARGRRYAANCGFAAVSIDAPGHGDRPRTAADEQFVARLRELMAAGQPVGPYVARHNAELAARAVPEWQSVLDALPAGGHPAEGRSVGYWGVSLGTAIGLPLVAADPRIGAAVFGCLGDETLTEAAARVSVPVEFLLQWDDTLVPRESGLALFDALASPQKSLHANSGDHMAVPRFEVDSAERFFLRHLATG
jgi:pimeloyl-ACP methyl ester carboxylesterase